MSNTTHKHHYFFQITHLEGDEAIARLRRYLISVFPEQPTASIDRALQRLPVRFSAVATPERARRLHQSLVTLGAQATMTEDPRGGITEGSEAPQDEPQEKEPPKTEAAGGSADTEETAPPSPEEEPPRTGEAPPPGEAPLPGRADDSATPHPSLAELNTTLSQESVRASAKEESPVSPESEGASTFFWTTWVRVLFSPRRFFATLSEAGGTFTALMFAAVLGLLAAILSFPAETLRGYELGIVSENTLTESYLLAIFLEPFWTVVGACVAAYFFHMGVRVLTGPHPFEVTLKVVAYATAASVFAAIPKAGPPVGALLALMLTLIGLSSAHRIRPIQAIGAVIFPLVLIVTMALAMAGLFTFTSYIVLKTIGA